MGQPKRFTAAFKAKVALEAVKGHRTALNWGRFRGSSDSGHYLEKAVGG